MRDGGGVGVQYGAVRYGEARWPAVRCGKVWYGVIRCGVIRCGGIRCSMGAVQCVVQYILSGTVGRAVRCRAEGDGRGKGRAGRTCDRSSRRLKMYESLS